jgi:hypothetical protein
MTARENPWIGQPTKIDAARLDATVHLSAADHELISISPYDIIAPLGGSRTARMAGPSARYWGLQRGIAQIGGQASGTIASRAGICGCGVPVTLPVTHGRLMC